MGWFLPFIQHVKTDFQRAMRPKWGPTKSKLMIKSIPLCSHPPVLFANGFNSLWIESIKPLSKLLFALSVHFPNLQLHSIKPLFLNQAPKPQRNQRTITLKGKSSDSVYQESIKVQDRTEAAFREVNMNSVFCIWSAVMVHPFLFKNFKEYLLGCRTKQLIRKTKSLLHWRKNYTKSKKIY